MYIIEHGSGKGYYFGDMEDKGNHSHTLEEVIELVAKYKEEEKMKEKIKEIFDLEWIREYAEANIDQTEWIEEVCGERRKILLIATLVEGAYGAYIPGIVLEMFGRAEGYNLEDPYDFERNETIHDALMALEIEVSECLNELIPAKGVYYMGYHEYDGSYCLFYMEECEEEEE